MEQNNSLDTAIASRISPKLYRDLKCLAEMEHRTVSQQVRKLISDHIKENKDKLPERVGDR